MASLATEECFCSCCGRSTDPGGRVVQGVGLRSLAYWDCGFESRRSHGCLSCECCALSGRGLCEKPIPRPEGYYRVCVCVCVCVCVTKAHQVQH
jgi:hypothetical protein